MNFIRCGYLFVRADKILAIQRERDDKSTIYMDKKLKITVDVEAESLVKMIDELENENDRTEKSDSQY